MYLPQTMRMEGNQDRLLDFQEQIIFSSLTLLRRAIDISGGVC